MNAFAREYSKWLNKKPLATKMITSAVIGFGGDVLCQGLERHFSNQHKEKAHERKSWREHNWWRTYVFTTIGLIYVAPMLHVHYSKILPFFVPG